MFFVSYANSDYVRDRKPNNGMLIDAKKWNINFKKVILLEIGQKI